jgi:hypothetical protein
VRAPVMGTRRGDDDQCGENGKVRRGGYGEHTRRGELWSVERERQRRGALTGWQAALRTRAVGQGSYAHAHSRRKTPPTLVTRDAAPGDTTSDWQAPLGSNFLFQIFPKLVFHTGKVARN